MKLTVSNRHAVPSEAVDENLDIDVTPIMNMFVVLIPFLVSMAVFTHLSVHQFYLPAEAGASLDQSSGPVKLKTTVVLSEESMLVSVGGDVVDSLVVEEGNYLFDSLPSVLTKAREMSGDKEKSVVSVKDKIPFKHVVTVMDLCRAAGFSGVGLASAPEAVPEEESK